MLEGLENIFNKNEEMLKRLKKEIFEKNTKAFIEENGHYFEEIQEYMEEAKEKERAAEEIGKCFVQAVKNKFSNKRGKIDSHTQANLNFFMIYYVFPAILSMETEEPELVAKEICNIWSKSFKDSNIQYADYDTLYGAFRKKIFGVF